MRGPARERMTPAEFGRVRIAAAEKRRPQSLATERRHIGMRNPGYGIAVREFGRCGVTFSGSSLLLVSLPASTTASLVPHARTITTRRNAKPTQLAHGKAAKKTNPLAKRKKSPLGVRRTRASFTARLTIVSGII